MKPLIKWPGGKGREIKDFKNLIPTFDKYIEPFFGGGAVFFYLEPNKAYINDISLNLTLFYKMVKDNNHEFIDYLKLYSSIWSLLLDNVSKNISVLTGYYLDENEQDLKHFIKELVLKIYDNKVILDEDIFEKIIEKNVLDKFRRTKKNEAKSPFSREDLEENLITGFMSGLYMYFRDVYNRTILNKIDISIPHKIANFYFIREYCYGSMFRYNSKGEFNIPYGGVSYNKKNFNEKINTLLKDETQNLLKTTAIHCDDFENFLNKLDLSEEDFIFLDPPYDTEFSDYEGREFNKKDQERLFNSLKKTKAKFLLVIKNTEFIFNLYKDDFNILSFDKNYSYNVRSRNERAVEHLIITNYNLNDYL